MQPIERYGVAALLFLVVTIGAVVLWDQAEAQGAGSGSEVAKAEAPDANKSLAGLNRNKVDRGQPKLPDTPNRAVHTAGSTPASGPSANGGRWSGTRGVQLNERQPKVPDPVEPILADAIGDGGKAGPDRVLSVPSDGWSAGKKPVNLGGSPVHTNGTVKPKPEPKSTRTYTVQSGDTMGQIAVDQLGSIKHLGELQAANPKVRAEAMSVGTVLRLPEVEGAPVLLANKDEAGAKKSTEPKGASAKPPALSGPTHRVVAGDSLWSIAAAKLGDGSRHAEIASLNPGSSSVLKVGQVLRLPTGAATKAPAQEHPKAPEAVASVTPERRFPKGVVR